jgi:hypothetical protein
MGHKWRYFKCPKTRNEKKQNQDGWCRAKRRPHNLVDSWDDKPHCHQRTWKKFRKTQYHPGGRGKKHTIYIDDTHISIWGVKTFFEEHDIPYDIEWVLKPTTFKRKNYKKVVDRLRRKYRRIWNRKTHQFEKDYNHQMGWEEVWHWEWDGTYKTYTGSSIVGYNITWWYDKDVGIEYVLEQNRFRN